MQETRELDILQAAKPGLFGLDPKPGLAACDAEIAKIRDLLKGLTRLRRSYQMKYIRSTEGIVARMAAEQQAGAVYTPAPVQREVPKELPPNPELDALLDKYLGD